MKNKYLVTTDLDETLLDSNSRILDESISFIQSFINDGNHFLINTGRPHQSAINFLKMMGVHEPMICSNGSAIVTYSDDYTTIKDYILFAIEHDLMKTFLKEIKPFVYGLVLNTIKNVYSYDFSKVPCWVVHESDIVKKVCGDVEEIFPGMMKGLGIDGAAEHGNDGIRENQVNCGEHQSADHRHDHGVAHAASGGFGIFSSKADADEGAAAVTDHHRDS